MTSRFRALVGPTIHPRCRVRAAARMGALLSGLVLASGCGSDSPLTQLEVDSFVSTCATDSDDCNGRPAEGASVEVRQGATKVVASGVLDEDGRIEFDLDPGAYVVVVTLGDLQTEPSEVMLSLGQYVSLTMPLPKAPQDS